jgi:DNA-binding CsgD family transcriptional regulator
MSVRALVVENHPLHARKVTLTSRETEVLQLMSVGNSNKQIAKTLAIAAETAKSHIRNIMAKLGARDRTHAVTLGLHRGMIQFPLRMLPATRQTGPSPIWGIHSTLADLPPLGPPEPLTQTLLENLP